MNGADTGYDSPSHVHNEFIHQFLELAWIVGVRNLHSLQVIEDLLRLGRTMASGLRTSKT